MIILESNFVTAPRDCEPHALMVGDELIFKDEFKDQLYASYFSTLHIKKGTTMKVMSSKKQGTSRVIELMTAKPIGFAGQIKTDIFGYLILNLPSGYRTDGWKV